MLNKISYFNFLRRETKRRILLDYFRVRSTIIRNFYTKFESRLLTRGRISPKHLRNKLNITVYK